MLIKMLKSKIHRATVTEADLNYDGSILAIGSSGADKEGNDRGKVRVYEYIENNKDQLNTNSISITMGSDGFFPFPDNIIEANRFGVKKIIQPGGSIMDNIIEIECKRLNIEMYCVGTRMFYH